MDNKFGQRIVSALAYFSIFFLPVIFPLIVWIIAKYQGFNEVRKNAVKAFWSQIFPLAVHDCDFCNHWSSQHAESGSFRRLVQHFGSFCIAAGLSTFDLQRCDGNRGFVGTQATRSSPGILVYKSVILVSALRQGFFILAY